MKRGFTLIELLAVIAIIGVIVAGALIAMGNARARARDTTRHANAETLKKALELYFTAKGEYPASTEVNDCNGGNGLATALQPLVDERLINEIPRDPQNPNNATPYCYYYTSDRNCSTGDVDHPYVLVVSTETRELNLPSWNNETRRYCLYP